ncbi:MAG: class I SAM-dependent methyltransferase [Asgard group archaeon]|nr:class I SAM-dependent methyltransferase [Asgard group archaeon]
MLIPASINTTDCFYCQEIQKEEKEYPIRKGKYSFEGLVNRCIWHSRFKCSECGKFFHFSFLFWCPSSNKVICGKCNKPTLHPVAFWNRTYAYAFDCKECGETHFDLLYSEFMSKHPWQGNKKNLFNEKNPLIPIVDERFAWEPIWKPSNERFGKKITVEESLKVENKILSYYEDYRLVTLHTGIVDENQVDLIDTKEKWEKTSQNWMQNLMPDEDKGDTSREFIIDPALWKQIGDVKGLKILDAGCGNGYLSRLLAKKGAKVTGIDISKHFIGFCKKKEKANPLGCEFLTGSLTDMSSIDSGIFDIVVSNIVMVDVQDYKSAFKEINRVLKPNGRFIWSNLHPVFGGLSQIFYRLPFDTSRNEERLCLMIDRYFDTGAILMSWGNIKPIWQFHRTLQDYTQALNKAGFLIREIIEPKPSIKDIQENPRSLAFDADRIPFFIIFDCLKYSEK